MKKICINIILALLYLVSLLPLRVHYFFSSILCFIVKNIFRYRFTAIVTNLSRSFPQLKYAHIKELTNGYYSYMCDLLAESIWDFAHSGATVSGRMEVEGEQIINEAQEKAGKVMIVMGHCGNWEMFSGMIGVVSKDERNTFTHHPIYTVYKAAENRFSDMLFAKLRRHEYRKFASKGEMVESKELARHTIKTKGEMCTYILIADQNPIGEHPMVVQFMNQPTMMLRGPEYLATKHQMAVVYMYMDRVARGRYKFTFDLITENAANEEKGFVTRQFASLLERDLNHNKINWLWSHKRWKREVKNCETD